MKISGATFVRNIEKYKYPAVQSLLSIIPVCDEIVVNVGDSDDGTRHIIEAVKSEKIKIFDSVWNADNRAGGSELSRQTNMALSRCSGDWIIYIQADEVLPEWEIPKLRAALEKINGNKDIEALAFDYLHFYGSYFTVQKARNWYAREVRAVRNGIGAESHGDAQGFRIRGRKPRAYISGCSMFHYGWARPPEVMAKKSLDFQKWWHSDEAMKERLAGAVIADVFPDLGNLVEYRGPHPGVMKPLVGNSSPDMVAGLRKEYLKRRGFCGAIRDFSRRMGRARVNFKAVAKC